MFNSLTAVIDGFLAFANQHQGGPFDLSAFLTADQIDELTTLDTLLYAYSHVQDVPLSVIPEREDDVLMLFRNSKLPYITCTTHIPFEPEAGEPRRELVCSGVVIVPTPEWIHAMKSLRATARLFEEKDQDNGKGRSRSPASRVLASSVGAMSPQHEGSHRAYRTNAKANRGRPAGSTTQAQDLKLYSDWKAAYGVTGMTKAEFLRERGLPATELAAIERGRKQSTKKSRTGKK
jgi:hypothetical protein